MLTINVGAAALARAEKLLEWIAARPEDVFLLTETSSGPGTAFLLDRFRSCGYAVEHAHDLAGERGAAIVSKIPVRTAPSTDTTGISLPGRLAFLHLDTEPVTAVMALYVPSRDRSLDKIERKSAFIESLTTVLDRLPTDVRNTLVVGGDYNVIARDHQPLHSGFLDFEFGLLETLERNSFVDAYQKVNPGSQAHSWIGRTGDGYRYDYLHVGRAIASEITNCEYLHETRELRLTDHAAVSLNLNVDVPIYLETTDLLVSDSEPLALF
jgi:exodeoxyribonuclease-3